MEKYLSLSISIFAYGGLMVRFCIFVSSPSGSSSPEGNSEKCFFASLFNKEQRFLFNLFIFSEGAIGSFISICFLFFSIKGSKFFSISFWRDWQTSCFHSTPTLLRSSKDSPFLNLSAKSSHITSPKKKHPAFSCSYLKS
ncbi:hypothetical protein ES703_43055 [subsurface metagenome]